MKYALLILTIVLFISCKNERIKHDLTFSCIKTTKVNPKYTDVVLKKTCGFKNHLFQSIGAPDYKGRYSYKYELFRIEKNDTLKINNTDFFNDNSGELEMMINKKLKAEYDSNFNIPEINDCMKWIKFRHYKLNEFGISFTDKNQMEFNMDYGIGSACFNVSSSSVVINLSALESYLK